MKSIRGAIAVVENTDESIVNASKSLINSIMNVNSLKEEDIVFALFTVTKDLTTAFPAKAFRELGMMSIPALDAKAPEIQNDLDGCIRILVTCLLYTSDAAERIRRCRSRWSPSH